MQLNDNGLYDIYGMNYVPLWQSPIFFWTVLVLAISILILLSIVFIRYIVRKKKIRAPWNYALIELKATEKHINQKDLSYNELKESYFRVTSILKSYMATRYSWVSNDLTDNELVAIIDLSDLSSEIKQHVKILYDNAIMIKFADKKTIIANLQNDIEHARIIISATIPSKKNSV